MNNEVLLTVDQVAEKMQLNRETVIRMAKAKQLPSLKVGKRFRFSWEAIIKKASNG